MFIVNLEKCSTNVPQLNLSCRHGGSFIQMLYCKSFHVFPPVPVMSLVCSVCSSHPATCTQACFAFWASLVVFSDVYIHEKNIYPIVSSSTVLECRMSSPKSVCLNTCDSFSLCASSFIAVNSVFVTILLSVIFWYVLVWGHALSFITKVWLISRSFSFNSFLSFIVWSLYQKGLVNFLINFV